ncbi:VOC family protein [Streptomyces sp. NPDC001984]
MATRLTAVVVEALDAQAQARFWARTLQWQLAESNPLDPQVAIHPPDADGIGLVFVPSIRPKTNKNRLHLDLTGGSSQTGQVRRLLALGASRVDIGQGQVPWEVLADPEGNEFCVLPEVDSDDRLAAICLDAADPAVQGRFWAAVTGWSVAGQGDWGVKLRSPAGTGPALVMGPPVAPKAGENRLRLDVAPWPGDDMAAEVGRLLDAGASRVDAGHGETTPRTLADPEGNEFGVLKAQRLKPSAL